jgi:SAM-dependent methyltransferase
MTQQNIDRNYYDRKYYEGHLKRLSGKDHFTKVKVDRVRSLLSPLPGELIMDLGCGVGTMMALLASSGAKMIGVDYSTASLSLAKQSYHQKVESSIFRGICSDGRAIGIQNDSIDGIMAVDFTEHLDDDFLNPMIADVYRVLKPNGRFVIYTPSVTHIFEQLKKRNIILKEDKSHIGLRTMKHYCDILIKSGFKIEKKYFKPTDIPVFNVFETLCMWIPGIGNLFKRRICVLAVKPTK